MEKLTINRWAEEDRPREKMMLKGAAALSDAELLAILIGSGNTEESAVALMQRLLADYKNDLNLLAKCELADFARYKGMGPAKSISLMAALELGKRRKLQEAVERRVIRSSKDIYALFHPLMCDLPTEEFWVLTINQALKVIDQTLLSRGGINLTAVDIRELIRVAVLKRATQVAVVHNHPSGNPNPSMEDVRLTERICEACRLMDIRLVDHLIVCDGNYYSFSDEGRL